MGPSNTMNGNRIAPLKSRNSDLALLCGKKYENSRNVVNRPKGLHFNEFCFNGIDIAGWSRGHLFSSEEFPGLQC